MNLVLNPSALAGLFVADTGVVAAALRLKAELIATEAKRLVKVDHGRLMGSIEVVMGHDDTGLVALVGSNVEYALYQELEPGDTFPIGSGKYAGAPRVRSGGKPYLRPAMMSGGGSTA